MRVSEQIKQFMLDQHIPGLAFAIQQNDTLLEERYYGYANLEHEVPVTADTIFEIASVTKLFTAQSILVLAQENKLHLEDEIGTYLKDLPESWKAVSIRQCLAHQSGIPSYTDVDQYWGVTKHDKSHNEILSLINALPLKFAPGHRHAYDNSGYYLLGLLIEAISGKRYDEYLRITIFEPLNMKHTRANNYSQIVPHRAQGYQFKDSGLTNKEFYSTSNTYSAGNLLSNVRDLLLWRTSLFNDTILNSYYRELWWTPHASGEANEREMHYSVCLGWFMVESPLGNFLGHNGGIPGFASSFIHFRDSGISAVVLCNAGIINDPHNIALAVLKERNLL